MTDISRAENARPEMVEAFDLRGRWTYVNDEGHDKGKMRHDDAVERVNLCADEGGVGTMHEPGPLSRRASQYVRRLRRRGQKARAAKRSNPPAMGEGS